MVSTTSLLDLPNELFPYFLQYLSSIDIFKAFAGIQLDRLQTLIRPFLTAIDLSKESDQWIQTIFPEFVHRNVIRALRIELNRLSLIPDDLFSIGIQSMEIIHSDYESNYSEQIMSQLRQNLKKLTLTSRVVSEIEYEHIQFLRSDSQLTHLTINSIIRFYSDTPMEISARLTYLSIVLDGMMLVFTFLKHLPNLRQLKVAIISEECYPQSPPDANGVQPCKTLRTVTFTGWIKYFDHIEMFFETFGSSIENVSLEILLMHRIINGTQLEHNLLDKMPRLSSLQLNISSIYVEDEPMQIETFQSFSWEQINPIVYWYDVRAQQHLLFTLPYRLDRVYRLSNECVSTCLSNRAVSLLFPRVRTLSLINTIPLNLETILFIEKCFPKVTAMKLTEKKIHPLDERDEEESTGLLSLDEDLLSNTEVQIPSVTKFCIRVYRQRVDYKTFHRFLCLFPNLVDLELSLGQPLLGDVLQHKHENNRVVTACTRINQLNIRQLHESDGWAKVDMHYLFPNVKKLVTYDCE